MKISDLFSIAIRNLWRRKLRTFLTVLGVIIGATSIIIMISLGLAIEKSQTEMLESVGDLTTITIHNNPYFMQFEQQTTSTAKAPPLNEATLKQLRGRSNVLHAFGFKEFNLQGEMKIGKYDLWSTILGVDPEYFNAFEKPLTQGRLFSPTDRYALLIPEEIKYSLWDQKTQKSAMEDPNFDIMTEKFSMKLGWEDNYPGSTSKSKKVKAEIIGVIGSPGWEIYMSLDSVKRLEAEQKKLFPEEENFNYGMGGNQQNKKKADDYDKAEIKVDSYENVKALQDELREEGFQAESMVDFSESVQESQRTIQVILGGIGSISLIVAAIGIMNTMVMSIYERTKEIGVMKVIGASVSSIRRIFLLEALLIGLFGGTIGVGLSLIISKGLNYYLGGMDEMRTISLIPFELIVLALLFSSLIGLISGYYPAKRATQLSAIEAIKTE